MMNNFGRYSLCGNLVLRLSFLLRMYYHLQSVIRLIDCLFSVDLLAPAHHSLSNSSHGSPNYYLLIRKVPLLLCNINTVRRFSLVRTFASNVIVVSAGSHPPNGSHWTPHRSDVWDRKPSGFIPHTQFELSGLVYYQMSSSFMF